MVGKWGRGTLQLLPPPAVRRPAAVTLPARDGVVGGSELLEFYLPPPPAAWRPAAAVSVHVPLLPPPAVRQPAAVALPDRGRVVEGWELV